MNERFKDVKIGDEVWVKCIVSGVDLDDDRLPVCAHEIGDEWVENYKILLPSEISTNNNSAPSPTFQVGDTVRVEMVDCRWEYWDSVLLDYFGEDLVVEHIDSEGDIILKGCWFPPHWLSLVRPAQKSVDDVSILEEQLTAAQKALDDLRKQIAEIKGRCE